MSQWFPWQWNIFHANVKEKISKGIYIHSVTRHLYVIEVSVKRLKVCLCISNYEDTNTHQCMYHMIYKPYINNGGLPGMYSTLLIDSLNSKMGHRS